MNRRNFMRFLGLTPAAALSVAPVAAEVARDDMAAEVQRLKDLAEFHQAAREAEAKTLDMLLRLKNETPALAKTLYNGRAVVLPMVQERKDA